MIAAGKRAAKVKAAGRVLHAHARAPGCYMRAGIAECSAREADGAEFTTWSKYVSCPECKAVIVARRVAAKVRAAAAGVVA